MNTDDFVIVEIPDELSKGESQSNGETCTQNEVTTEDVAAIRSWLSPTEFDSDGSEYHKHLNAHAPGTGDWLVQAEAYQKWHDSTEATTGGLWIQGIPGSGKSVVAARLIQRLTGEETAPVVCFFARRIIKSNSHPQNLVRDCLYQLLDHSVALQVRLKDLRNQNSSIEYCSFQELWRAFLLGLSTLTRAYIVFDALDELAVEENDFLPLLLDLAQMSPQSIKLIITSRPVPHLLDMLRGPSLGLIRLTRRAVETDIATYIEQRLSQQEERTLTDEQQAVIKETLCRKAQGLFLYARLMLDQLMQQHTTPVHQHLQRLPESLEDMYVNLLNEHAARSRAGLPFQSWLLSWITHSTRPLRVTELAALALSTADRAGLNNDQDAKLMVRTACGPLLEILENETVQVIHHSFTEFLLDSHRPTASESSTNAWFPAFLPTATHRSLTLSIINYLLSGCFTGWGLDWDKYCGPGFEKQHQDLMLQFPFLQYAVHNLLDHAASCDIEDPEIMQALDRLFDTKPDVFNAWKDFWFASISDYGPDEFSPIHVAARAGLAHYTAHLIAKGEDPNVEDSTGQTPTGFAAMNGNSQTLDVLLNSHASITDFDSDGLAPIHYAARGDHVGVLQRLLDAGADPLYPRHAGNRPRSSSPGKTPIEHACQRGNTSAAMLLLQHTDETKRRCVLPHWAAVKGQANTLRALLEYPEIRANVAVKDAAGNTALYLAACSDSAATVDLLLRHGADVYARSSGLKSKSSGRVRERWTALQAWANGHASSRKYYRTSVDEWEQVGELLIRAGSDIEARDDEGKTVIFYWSLHGTFGENDDAGARFVSLLLRHGANARALDSDGNSVLHECYSYYGTGAVMRLLVDAGADINHARKTDGATPLIGAAKRQFEDIKMFTNRGADPNLQDLDGNTALHWICRSWVPGLATLRAWLQVADPTIRNNAGQTCIYNLELGDRGHERVQAIPLFVEKGLDLESRDRRGRTALLGACENGEQHFITALLQHGACATATDFENKTCLHILGQVMLSSIDHGAKDRKISVDVMSHLIEAGANINAVDNHGNTAFHDAIAIDDYFRPVQVRLEALLELGAVPNTPDKHGRTVLHKIASLPGEPFADRFHWLQNAEISLDLHARDYQGLMPIHCAAAAEDVNVLKLAKAGADLQARVDNGRNVLHLAAGAGQGSALGLLCKLYSDSKWEINQPDEKGRTPLHYAAASGSSECVFYLLQAGADPNAQDRRGLTALHAATEYQINVDALRRRRRDAEFPYGEDRGPSYESIQRLMSLRHDSAVHKAPEAVRAAVAVEEEVQMIQDSVALLLSAGAKTGLCDNSGWTAYDLAVYLGRQEMAAVLESVPDGGGAQVSSASSRWYSLRSVYANQIVQQLNVGGCDHYTVLHSALSQRNEVLVEALLDAGVDATVRGPDGLTPVHYVAFWGLVSVMKLMARYIEDLNAFNPPLLHAALCRKASNVQMVHLLISHGANVNAHFQVPLDKNTWTASASGYNAVHMLAAGQRWWHISALESLCKAGADIEATDSHGRTVLQCALTADNSVRHGAWQEDTLDIILTHGANINAQSSKDGSTALQRALKFRWSRPVIERLLRHGADISLGDVPAIHAAVESRVVESCEAILNAGADLNTLCHRPSGRRRYFVRSEGPHIETPLLAAAMKSSYEYETHELDKQTPVISFLLQQGADPLFELPGEGSTTTVFHEICHYHGIVSPFIEAGIDLETINGDGLTPLLVSCSSPKTLKNSLRHESTPIELINAGANVHATDGHGSTALHLATKSGLCETVSLLIQKGASVSATNDAGLTPLYYAVDNGYTEKSLRLTKALLTAGADPLLTGPNGEGPLHILAASLMQFSPAGWHESNYQSRDELDYFAESKALYKTFTDAGCDPNARDNKGNTPLFPYVREVKEECEVFNPVPPAEEDVRDMFDTHDVFAVNDDGDTLLHAIASREEEERSEEDAVLLFRELLARGLDVRRENNKGLSALDVAITYGKQAILELFEREE